MRKIEHRCIYCGYVFILDDRFAAWICPKCGKLVSNNTQPIVISKDSAERKVLKTVLINGVIVFYERKHNNN